MANTSTFCVILAIGVVTLEMCKTACISLMMTTACDLSFLPFPFYRCDYQLLEFKHGCENENIHKSQIAQGFLSTGRSSLRTAVIQISKVKDKKRLQKKK